MLTSAPDNQPSSASSSRNTQPSISSSSNTYSSLRLKGSFANLFALIGISSAPKKSFEEEDDDDDEDDDEEEEDEGEGGRDEEQGVGEVDEESLMWDAQTALISHHPELAIRLYTQAALPPFCSPSACLALGNLLIRGSSLTEHEQHDFHHHPHHPQQDSRIPPHDHANTSSTISSRILGRFFGSPASASTPASSSTSHTIPSIRPIPSRRTTADLVASGWQIPKDGKRAVRDAKSMGVAGAWFVLGLSWLVQVEMEREKESRRRQKSREQAQQEPVEIVAHGQGQDRRYGREGSIDTEEILSFDPKNKHKGLGRERVNRQDTSMTITESDHCLHKPENTPPIDLSDSTDTICPPKAGSNPSSTSGRTSESTMLKTPGDALVDDPFNQDQNQDIEDAAKDLEVLQTMYNLLQPLLKLYRHGHIQSHDPVALPPISLSTLPAILRPRNETEKGRNVWKLGHVVASKIKLLDLLKREEKDVGVDMKEIDRLRGGVDIIINYILAMTSQDLEVEIYFKNVISNPPTGYEVADDLIRQAAKRLDIITSSPKDEDTMNGFPFPDTHLSPPKIPPKQTKSPRKPSLTTHGRKHSTSSVTSLSAPRILSTPIKSSASMASLSSITDDQFEPVTVRLSERESEDAMSTLRRVHAKSMADLTEALEEQGQEEYYGIMPKRNHPEISTSPTNTLRAVASSPQFGTLRPLRSNTGSSTPARRALPFEPSSDQQINPIDPELAKAELSSALTKHVTCGVCGMQGVNFPECRKCGLTFCSRECRVGEERAGNGKKHICGLWESKKLLSGSSSNSLTNSNLTQRNVEKGLSPVRAARVY
uniref:Uncharacterized protein n=1 Tax=Kwoniella bestiolae CBS 10118 TaxID=1296100 RepID=A0A1B9GFC9_9TREE|nr:hypothetical protein I302_01187 [Kwoniella bestiolae CBS 10118]OCF29675.1 hypothetical protein I302_01187 [Kwoniella bestiolae CBS 10118]